MTSDNGANEDELHDEPKSQEDSYHARSQLLEKVQRTLDSAGSHSENHEIIGILLLTHCISATKILYWLLDKLKWSKLLLTYGGAITEYVATSNIQCYILLFWQ